MDLSTIRAVVEIIVGILYTIVVLALLAVVIVVNMFASRYLNKAHTLMDTRLQPLMVNVQGKAELVRQRTAALPGQPRPADALPPPTGPGAVRLPFSPLIMFRRRKRPWWRRILPG